MPLFSDSLMNVLSYIIYGGGSSTDLITSPPIGGGRGIVMPMSVCLFVCVFVCVCVCLSVFSQNFKV